MNLTREEKLIAAIGVLATHLEARGEEDRDVEEIEARLEEELENHAFEERKLKQENHDLSLELAALKKDRLRLIADAEEWEKKRSYAVHALFLTANEMRDHVDGRRGDEALEGGVKDIEHVRDVLNHNVDIPLARKEDDGGR